MPRDERDRFADLFSQLMHADHGRAPHSERDSSDRDSALRLLSHSLLNYLCADGTDAADELGRALPWLAAFLDFGRDDAGAGELAGRLVDTPAVSTLSAQMIQRRLSSRAVGHEAALARRAVGPRLVDPNGANQIEQDPQIAVFAALAETEARLAPLAELPEDELRARLMGDSATLAAAVELCEDAADNPLAERLRRSFVSLRFDEPVPAARRRSDSLWILAKLEAADDGDDPLEQAGFELSRRARGFERGLAQNMNRLELIPAVRAALAFGPGPGEGQVAGAEISSEHSKEKFEAQLRQFAAFRSDPALHQLALALIEVRWLCVDNVCGGAPLKSLSPWVDYLRGACLELAEVRECTLREAMSYAHYCLHLVDVCDFAAMGPDAFNDSTRDALGGVEEELKEFALAGQREGLSDGEADLGRFERARWRRAGEAAYLADRLSRLRGAWRRGTSPGPLGAPPQLDAEVTAHSLALVESLVGASGEADIASLAGLVENARFVEFLWLEKLEPSHLLKLLAIAAASARDLPGVDISRPFLVDLGPLGRWAGDPERGRLNRRILAALLDQRKMGDILQGQNEPAALRRGIVGQADAGSADAARPASPTLTMSFVANDELKALLELMGTTTADSGELQAALEKRLHQVLDNLGDDDASSADADPSEGAQVPAPPSI
ncbi:MAG: hypothetical protein ACLFVJ_14170 [Persicimonas sp.]